MIHKVYLLQICIELNNEKVDILLRNKGRQAVLTPAEGKVLLACTLFALHLLIEESVPCKFVPSFNAYILQYRNRSSYQ